MAYQWLRAPFLQHQRKPRQFFRSLLVQQSFDVYVDQQLRARYCFELAGIRYLKRLLGRVSRRSTDRNRHVHVRMQNLVALRSYVTGDFVQVTGDTFETEWEARVPGHFLELSFSSPVWFTSLDLICLPCDYPLTTTRIIVHHIRWRLERLQYQFDFEAVLECF